MKKIEKIHIRQSNKFVERIQPKWSAQTQKFFLYCIGKANNDGKFFKKIEMTTYELAPILGYEENTKIKGSELKEIYTQLHQNASVQIIDDESRQYISKFLFEEINFDINNGKIKIIFSESMKEFILNTQIKEKQLPFTDIQYKEIIDTKSSYATRLIELLHQYKKIGRRLFPYKVLRDLLSVPEDKYKNFDAFKRRVIDQAVNEINNNPKSTITVSYTTIKAGRYIGSIEFIIKTRRKITRSEVHAEIQLSLYEQEVAAGLVKKVEDLENPELAPWLNFPEPKE